MNPKANITIEILHIPATMEILLKLFGKTPKKLDVVMLVMKINAMEFASIIQQEITITNLLQMYFRKNKSLYYNIK